MDIKETVPGSNGPFMFGRWSHHFWLVVDRFLRSAGNFP